MKNAFIKYDESYEKTIDEYYNDYFYFSCNIILCKRQIFDEYCNMAFYIADQIESDYSNNNIARSDRFMGFIFEHILSIFIKKHYNEWSVKCTELDWIKI